MMRTTWSLPVDGGLIGGIRYDGDGPDLLFVHSVGVTAMTWSTVIDHLPAFRATSLDLRGHGRSLTAPLLTSDHSWRDIITVIDAFDLHRPVLIGHTTGGFLALAAAADRPDLVSAVVTLEAGLLDAPRPLVHAELEQVYADSVLDTVAKRFGFGEVFQTEQDVEAAIAGHRKALERDLLASEIRTDATEEIRYSIVERPNGTWVRTPTREAMRAAHTIAPDARYYPSADLYRQIHVPVHVVQAQDGISLIPADQLDQLTAELPNLHVHDILGGHLAHYSHARALARIISSVAAETKSASPV